MSTTVPEPPVTGHPAIDAALSELNLDLPVAEHAAGFLQVHGVLQQVLNPSPDQTGPGHPGGDRQSVSELTRPQTDASRPAPRPGPNLQRR